MSKPLAIDLFCGLFQAELFRSGYTFVQNLVASWAKNPYHVSLAIGHQPPAPVTLETWAMRNLNNASLTAYLAGGREVWIFSSEAHGNGVSVWPARVIDLLNSGVLAMEGAALNFRSFGCATVRAVALVAIRRRDIKMLSAYSAITAKLCHIGLFAPTQTPLPLLTTVRAVTLVRTFCFKSTAAHCAE